METKFKAAPADGVAPPKPAKPTAGVPAELPAAKGGAGAGAQPKGRKPPAAQKPELEGTCVTLLAEKLQLMASAQAMHDTISSTPEWMAWAKKLQHAIAALRGAGADDFGRRVAFGLREGQGFHERDGIPHTPRELRHVCPGACEDAEGDQSPCQEHVEGGILIKGPAFLRVVCHAARIFAARFQVYI